MEYSEVTGDVDIEITHKKLVSIHEQVVEHTHGVTRAVWYAVDYCYSKILTLA